jgi:hypothetical protein
MEECLFSGGMEVTTKAAYSYIGGLSGHLSGASSSVLGKINKSAATGDITVNNNTNHTGIIRCNVGGLVGSVQNDTAMTDSEYKEGIITVSSLTGLALGGVYGQHTRTNAYVRNCASNAEHIYANRETISAPLLVGGFGGFLYGTQTVNNNWNYSTSPVTVNVMSSNDNTYIGGFYGLIENSTIAQCYATGEVNVTTTGLTQNYSDGRICAGGFAGYLSANGSTGTNTMINNCYALGNVTVDSTGDYSIYYLRAGGLVGYVYGNTSSSPTYFIQYSYAAGSVLIKRSNGTTQSLLAGGIAGGFEVEALSTTKDINIWRVAALGESVIIQGSNSTATNGYANRICGNRYDNYAGVYGLVLSRAHAIDTMRTGYTQFPNDTYTGIIPTSTGSNTNNGSNMTAANIATQAWWTHTNYLTLNTSTWDFSKLSTNGGRPLLQSAGPR